METVTENQEVTMTKKLEKMFGHLDYKNPPELCPVRDVMSVASDQWSILILLWLGYFPVLRFNKLKKYVYGISNKVLSQRLKVLEADGYISRKAYAEVPIRVEYSLTDFGKNYVKRLLSLAEWMQENSPKVLANREKYGLV
ncbi:winged helix-turn-helix transcriptional regulator [Flagellimonas lutaonensis]|jgi:DNA-binding HxlR family transcriptional regulator|uniref:Transcriptional regulator, HxlR family n=1 Tax=Flagellimonas lutaonensis TaxID=516051 RepID=A0A0D5YR33_9FLAO|nr:helix-turn-helix domain-containing protein [Allomuricauda lutaonensis]AKA34379.1 Transcriptional regulator, HxlR family [Allomuricauda lutaonensis]MAU26519.1 transcriptional regulator [Allomuricauda sp.]|tara:strand:+ start:13250 stop:13672 length:423 start_codon:yes stop_codon:yes gene_type:complete